jgi:hypothetical protein
MFKAVRQHVPKLATWVEYCYGTQAKLFLDSHLLSSQQGVQQGDPLGPLLFALTLQPLVLKIAEQCPELDLNAWFLDDGNLVGSPDSVHRAVEIIGEEGPRYGLHLGKGKCELWWPTRPDDEWEIFPKDFIRVDGGGVKVLGGPVGNSEFAEKFTSKRVQKIRKLLELMKKLEDPHMEVLLLRYCVGMPKFTVALRTTDPRDIPGAIHNFDEAVYDALIHIFGLGPQVHQRDLIGLPLRLGGLGIPQASHIALSAYIGSMLDSRDLCQSMLLGHNVEMPDLTAVDDGIMPKVESLLARWNAAIGESRQVSLDDLLNTSKIQKHMTDIVHDRTLEHLKGQGNAHFRAVVNGCTMENSSEWTNLLPTYYANQTMEPVDFRLALRYHYGMPVFNGDVQCVHCQSVKTDMMGIHTASCPSIHSKHHDDFRDALLAECRRAKMMPSKEPKWLLEEIKGTNERPADVFLPNYRLGSGLCIDVSVVSSFTNLSDAAREVGFNAKRAEKLKKNKYERFLHERGLLFKPFVMESLGGFGEDSKEVIDRLASSVKDVDSVKESFAAKRLRARLSFIWHRNLGAALTAQFRCSSSHSV